MTCHAMRGESLGFQGLQERELQGQDPGEQQFCSAESDLQAVKYCISKKNRFPSAGTFRLAVG